MAASQKARPRRARWYRVEVDGRLQSIVRGRRAASAAARAARARGHEVRVVEDEVRAEVLSLLGSEVRS